MVDFISIPLVHKGYPAGYPEVERMMMDTGNYQRIKRVGFAEVLVRGHQSPEQKGSLENKEMVAREAFRPTR